MTGFGGLPAVHRMMAAVILSLAALAGCQRAAQPVAGAPPLPEVVTIRVAPEPARSVTTAVGTLEPVARVLVASQEEGLVTAVAVREGDRVRSRQVVVELDDRQLRAELTQAEAALDEARARWQRVEKLRAEGVMAEQDVDAALAANRIAEAQLEALQTRLSFTRIQAPVSGVVTARHVEVGDLASPRAPLLELAAGDGLLLRVPVSELEVVRLAEGDLADITVDALPELRLQGRIARIYPAADSASRQVTVELKIAEAPPTVRLGFLARAHLVLETMPAALLVPEDAVLRGAEAASFVWLVRDGVAAMRPVEVGLRIDGRAVISRGLAPGDQVVVSGMAKVREGAPVAVVGAAGEPG
ncbi:MAG TPA: efflux RND transporter periplasmic adaptor subunit [Thermoanaerobaculales bacterium]|nr:efflux RND transporter periplasmic adaptor subunit [Thermoanaerobaculales bacterium]HQL31242.1 efflux RND transporter periplasmic adaptor subunit [Thermoanaerobaculales bacterium]